MQAVGLGLFLMLLPRAGCRAPLATVSCSQGLACRLVEEDVLCSPGAMVLASGPVLVPTHMRTESVLRCAGVSDCLPCVRVELQLVVLGSMEEAPRQGIQDSLGKDAAWHQDGGPLLSGIMLSAWMNPSSHCIAMEVQLPHALAHPNDSVGSVRFDCFEAALRGDVQVMAYTSPRYWKVLSQTHHVPDCSWPAARGAIRLCQVPRLQVSVGPEEAVVQVRDVPAGQNFTLWFYRNQTHELRGLSRKTVSGPQNYSLPSAQLLPCLCLQVWPEVLDPPRTSLCPFLQDPAAWAQLWAQTQVTLKLTDGILSCSVSVQCVTSAELVPCWRPKRAGPCHELPHLHQALTLSTQSVHEFQTLRPHPNLCVQVRSAGFVQLTQCLQEGALPGRSTDLLLMETRDTHGNKLLCAVERGTCVPLANSTCMGVGVGALEQQLQEDVQAGRCMKVWPTEGSTESTIWACSLENYLRAHWLLAWMGGLLSTCCLLFLLLLKKEDLKGWLKFLKEGYSSGGMLRGRRALILYSPDHAGFERLVSTLASALTRLQLSVSLELWSRAELCAVGPMQWVHAQRLRVLQEGGTVVLLFSRDAVARCKQWLLWTQGDLPPQSDPHSTFLASLNCVLPDFLAGKARGRYLVACFEDLLRPADIPELFCSVPIFTLPSQLPTFLLALAGAAVGREQKGTLKKHALWISDSLQRAIRECQSQEPKGHCTPPTCPCPVTDKPEWGRTARPGSCP